MCGIAAIAARDGGFGDRGCHRFLGAGCAGQGGRGAAGRDRPVRRDGLAAGRPVDAALLRGIVLQQREIANPRLNRLFLLAEDLLLVRHDGGSHRPGHRQERERGPLQPGLAQPAPHIAPLEAQPDIGHLLTQPLVRVPVHVGDDEAAAGLDQRCGGGEDRALHGLTRTLVANMVEGVTAGFKRELEVVGVGYKAEKAGKAEKKTLTKAEKAAAFTPVAIKAVTEVGAPS